MAARKSYPKPHPLTTKELLWFEEMIRLQANNQPIQLEMKLDTGTTEFGAGFDDEEELPMTEGNS